MYIQRKVSSEITNYLLHFPAVAILGPRQCGKSTLAKFLIQHLDDAIYLDLEKRSDQARLTDPEMFFKLNHEKLICLDEVQKLPELFSDLRSTIDEQNRNGQFLILGSASRDLIKQSSETLAGRIVYIYLTPFTYLELKEPKTPKDSLLTKYLVRGGFPRSYLTDSAEISFKWRQSFIETFLQRDLPQMGFNIPPETALRLWKMCAHSQGQLLNASKFGDSLGFSHTTIKKYLDVFVGTFMLRLLPPFTVNTKKRMLKSPKIYIRDTGILHALLHIESMNELLGHPVFGASWETLVIENVIGKYREWDAGFYRSSNGAEIDLVLRKGQKTIAIECKATTAPKLSRGFYSAMADLNIDTAFVIAPVETSYPINEKVTVVPLKEFLKLKM
ncbi:MAG: ATP-binding protein [Bacteroidales bacterium]|nr:ATP-binding protein [Bacteroidales bacterium]